MLPHKQSKPQLKMKAHLTSSSAPSLVQNHPHSIQSSSQYKFQMSILEENFYSKYFLQTCILSHIGLLYSIKVNVAGPIILAATLSGEQVFKNVQRANQASLHTSLNQVDQQRKKSTQNCNKQKQENFVFNSEPQVSTDKKLLTSRAERLSMQDANKLFHFFFFYFFKLFHFKVLKSISVVCVILSR